MPGLIETHFHMWSSLGRNFVSEGFEYFPAKWATSAHYEPDDFHASVLLGLVECLNAGITTVHDWDHNTRTPAHADAELRAHRDGLVRARYAYGHRDMLPVDEALDFTDIDRVRDEWFGPSSPFEGLVHLGVNLRGPDLGEMAVFDVEMRDALDRGLPVAIHTVQGGSTEVSATGPRGARLPRARTSSSPISSRRPRPTARRWRVPARRSATRSTPSCASATPGTRALPCCGCSMPA